MLSQDLIIYLIILFYILKFKIIRKFIWSFRQYSSPFIISISQNNNILFFIYYHLYVYIKEIPPQMIGNQILACTIFFQFIYLIYLIALFYFEFHSPSDFEFDFADLKINGERNTQ